MGRVPLVEQVRTRVSYGCHEAVLTGSIGMSPVSANNLPDLAFGLFVVVLSASVRASARLWVSIARLGPVSIL
jgi:hypothetical protein